MTKNVRVENADGSNFPVRVSVFDRGGEGKPDALQSTTQLDHPTALGSFGITSSRYLVVEEVGADGKQFQPSSNAAAGVRVHDDALRIAESHPLLPALIKVPLSVELLPRHWLVCNPRLFPQMSDLAGDQRALIEVNAHCTPDGALVNGVFGDGFEQADSKSEEPRLERRNSSAQVNAVKLYRTPPTVNQPNGDVAYGRDRTVHLGVLLDPGDVVVVIRAKTWADVDAEVRLIAERLAGRTA